MSDLPWFTYASNPETWPRPGTKIQFRCFSCGAIETCKMPKAGRVPVACFVCTGRINKALADKDEGGD